MAPFRLNPTLSEDLISEILVRVPVKSLLCFQSVCKTWLALIKHPAFVKSQLRHAITIETDQTLIISYFKRESDAGEKIALLHVDSREIVVDLKYPYSRDEFKCRPGIKLIGSANGIVCVATSFFGGGGKTIYLWNPAIRQSRLIASCSISDKNCASGYGFGYDPIDDDFKVVRVLTLPSAEVYSANENVWRNVPDPIDFPQEGDFDVSVCGFLCAFGWNSMMTFDLNKEVLNCGIKLPLIFDDDEARITEFNNSVAVIISRNISEGYNTDRKLDQKIYVWMLDDNACLRGGGIEASWTPMFNIDLVTPVTPPEVYLGYFSNRDLLLLIISDGRMWISCNADKKEVKIVPLPVHMANYVYTRGGYKYTESLVSLQGFKQVNWNAGEDYN